MKNIALTSTLAAFIGIAACTSTTLKPHPTASQKTAPKTSATAPDMPTKKTEIKEASAPKSTAAPVAPSMLAVSLAFPTGDVATSSLLVEKLAPRELLVGQPFDYQIQVTNLTGIALSNVVLTDTFPDEMTINKISPKAEVVDGLSRWTLGSFQPNEAKVIVVNATAKKPGTLSTCTSVSYDAGLCFSMPVVAPALSLAMSAPAEVLLCNPIDLLYKVRNSGTGTARGVVVNGQLPTGLKTQKGLTSFSENVGDLGPGQSRDLVIVAFASKIGSYVNTAAASASGGLTAKASEVPTIVRQPVLAIEKSGTEKTFAGRDIEYSVKVTNTGDAVARNATLEDVIPANTTFNSASAGGKSLADRRVQWSLGDLRPGESKTVQLRLQAESIGRCDSKAVAKADCADAVNDPHQTEIVGIPAIRLEVIDLADPIEVGANVTYEIVVMNQGSAAATSVKVACTLPENVEYVSSKGELVAGGVVGRSVSFLPIASLAPQKKVTFRVVVRGMSAADARFKVALTSDQLTTPVEETEATNYYK